MADRIPIRTVRIPDELWDAAHAAVTQRGDRSLSKVIRRMLMGYIQNTPKVVAQRQAEDENRLIARQARRGRLR